MSSSWTGPAAEEARRFAHAGATDAAAAIASLFGLPDTALPLLGAIRTVAEGELGDALFASAGGRVAWAAAVFTDVTGRASGHVGIVVSAEVIETLLDRFLSRPPKEGEDWQELARSALCELGNIATSAAAGGFASLAGGTVLPSTPRVLFPPSPNAPQSQLHAELNRLRACLVDAPLRDADRELWLRLVWIPTHTG